MKRIKGWDYMPMAIVIHPVSASKDSLHPMMSNGVFMDFYRISGKIFGEHNPQNFFDLAF
jgi:hypothetical protein